MGIASLKRKTWRTIFDAVDERKRHHYDRMEAREALAKQRAIERARPDQAVSAANEKLIREYAQDRLGGLRFAPWLRTYTACHGTFREGWLPNNFYGHVIRPLYKSSQHLGDLKTTARRFLGTDLLPDLASRVRGSWLDGNGEPISQNEAKKHIFASSDEAFLKRDSTQRAEGVERIHLSKFDEVVASTSDDFVIQALIKQDPFYDRWNTSATTALRFMTIKHHGKPAELRAANVSISARGAIALDLQLGYRCPIDLETGRLMDIGYDYNYVAYDAHGDTGERFGSDQIPKFAEIKEKVLQLHDRVPYALNIGWDVITDATGDIKLMEWNTGHVGVTFQESTTGPIFPELSNKDWRPIPN